MVGVLTGLSILLILGCQVIPEGNTTTPSNNYIYSIENIVSKCFKQTLPKVCQHDLCKIANTFYFYIKRKLALIFFSVICALSEGWCETYRMTIISIKP